MLCVNPYRTGKEEFGCGKCLPCRFSKRRMWVGRMLLESRLHRHSCFVTLTYKRCPDGLRKEDFQRFVRALRKRGLHCRYLAVGEFGTRSGRPHFHAVLFGVSIAQGAVLRRCWDHGFIDVGEFNGRTASYVAKYLCKSYDKGEPPVVLRSLKPGIGGDFAPRLAGVLPGRLSDVPAGIRVDGRIVAVGRYVRKKVRVLLGREGTTPVSERERMRAEYAAEDSLVREARRENQYLSALARLEIMRSKEKL